ncbi:MAG: hypothetical protein HZC28_09945 [Spirochaetes bacterium]|nr:hypothetical protein [Spirochaetota bacterium]
MAQSNRISLTFDPAEQEQIDQAIGTLKQKLLPKLKTLSAEDRSEMLKMGDKTMAFVTKAYDYAAQHPSFVPAFLDMNEFKTDRTAVENLRTMAIQINEIADAVNDSTMLSGSEAYQVALMFYNSTKNAVKSKLPDAEPVYRDLSERFPGRPKNDAAAVKNA